MTSDTNQKTIEDSRKTNVKSERKLSRKRRTNPIQAGSLKFAIDKFSQECLPLQFLREATENSLEAITDEKSGSVKWTYDPIWNDRNGSFKLCIIDNGAGMTGREVSKYINNMWESGKGVGHEKNFGMGVKISAIPKNPLGIEYYTWKDGIGYFARLWYDSSIDDYGMKLLEDENGGMVDWLEDIHDRFMPSIIKNNGGNGTKVVFLGMTEEEDTFVNTDAPMPSKWVSYNLNNRYYRLPENMKILCRRIEGERKPSRKLGRVRGIEYLLSRRSTDKGSMKLSDGKLHWMLLGDATEKDRFTDFDAGAQSGAVFHEEIYHKQNRMGHRNRMASKFGLLFSHNRVAIFVEPAIKGLDTDMVRSKLVMPNHEEGLPWSKWGLEFREDMPEPIRKLEAELNDKAQRGNDLEIQNRIRNFLKENPLPRFESSNEGEFEADTPDSQTHKEGSGGSGEDDLPDQSADGVDKKDYSYYLKPKSKRKADEKLRKPPPIDISWICLADGTRDPEYLTDMAGDWLPGPRKLMINRDFRMWKSNADEVLKSTSDGDAIRDEHILKRCELEYSWDLALTILKAYKINDNINWDKTTIETKMLSSESLTGASLSNKYLISYLKSNMGKWLVKKNVEEYSV